MKKHILITTLLAGFSFGAYAQGTVSFNNFFSTGLVDYNTTATPATGIFTVELLYGAPGTSIANLNLGATFTTSSSATGGEFYDTTTVTLTGITPGNGSNDTAQNVELAIVGWQGNYSSLAAAQAAHALTGETGEFTNPTGGAGTAPSIAAPANLVGWTSANPLILTVPEPSTIALGGLGAAALLLFRRRK